MGHVVSGSPGHRVSDFNRVGSGGVGSWVSVSDPLFDQIDPFFQTFKLFILYRVKRPPGKVWITGW